MIPKWQGEHWKQLTTYLSLSLDAAGIQLAVSRVSPWPTNNMMKKFFIILLVGPERAKYGWRGEQPAQGWNTA